MRSETPTPPRALAPQARARCPCGPPSIQGPEQETFRAPWASVDGGASRTDGSSASASRLARRGSPRSRRAGMVQGTTGVAPAAGGMGKVAAERPGAQGRCSAGKRYRARCAARAGRDCEVCVCGGATAPSCQSWSPPHDPCRAGGVVRGRGRTPRRRARARRASGGVAGAARMQRCGGGAAARDGVPAVGAPAQRAGGLVGARGWAGCGAAVQLGTHAVAPLCCRSSATSSAGV